MEPSPESIKPIQKYNILAIVSFILGLMAATFPIISLFYLVTVNGGPKYLQSLFCGIPFTFVAIITGTISLVQIIRKNQQHTARVAVRGAWMAIVGIVFGILLFGNQCIMVAILIIPFFMGVAH